MNDNMLSMVAPVPQFNRPTQSFNPIQMAQMLRNRFMRNPANLMDMQYPQMTGVDGMGDSMGTGISPLLNRIPTGLNMGIKRGAYTNFFNSMNGG